MRNRTYPNLMAEMSRIGLSQGAVADELYINKGTMSAKLNHPQRLLLREAILIRDHFFPDMTLDYLFDTLDTADTASPEKAGGGDRQ